MKSQVQKHNSQWKNQEFQHPNSIYYLRNLAFLAHIGTRKLTEEKNHCLTHFKTFCTSKTPTPSFDNHEC